MRPRGLPHDKDPCPTRHRVPLECSEPIRGEDRRRPFRCVLGQLEHRAPSQLSSIWANDVLSPLGVARSDLAARRDVWLARTGELVQVPRTAPNLAARPATPDAREAVDQPSGFRHAKSSGATRGARASTLDATWAHTSPSIARPRGVRRRAAPCRRRRPRSRRAPAPGPRSGRRRRAVRPRPNESRATRCLRAFAVRVGAGGGPEIGDQGGLASRSAGRRGQRRTCASPANAVPTSEAAPWRPCATSISKHHAADTSDRRRRRGVLVVGSWASPRHGSVLGTPSIDVSIPRRCSAVGAMPRPSVAARSAAGTARSAGRRAASSRAAGSRLPACVTKSRALRMRAGHRAPSSAPREHCRGTRRATCRPDECGTRARRRCRAAGNALWNFELDPVK